MRARPVLEPLLRKVNGIYRRRRFIPGFTLIELILVIGIVAILVGMSSPRFQRSYSRIQLRESALNLINLVNYCAEMSVVDKTRYRLSIETNKGQYRISSYRWTPGGVGGYAPVASKAGRVYKLPRGVRFETRVKELVFFPDGESEKAELKIIDNKGNGYRIVSSGLGSAAELNEIKK